MEEDVEEGHVEEFAGLCAAVAARYPDVEYFQIWNEMRLLERLIEQLGLCPLYEIIQRGYDAVKAERPDAKVGGPIW